MKCPYVIHRQTVIQTNTEYNQEGQQDNWIEVQNNTAEFAECQKENCGAWRDGRCHYKD